MRLHPSWFRVSCLAAILVACLAGSAAAITIVVDSYGTLTGAQKAVVDAKIAKWQSRIPGLTSHVFHLSFNNADMGSKSVSAVPGVEYVWALRGAYGPATALEDGAPLASTDGWDQDPTTWRPRHATILINSNPAIPWYTGTIGGDFGPVTPTCYDLWTVINHELCHALGFTVNYDRFKRNVVTNPNGSRTYNPGGQGPLTAPLTPDGTQTHIDPTQLPNDLMVPGLGPGIRRTPSDVDFGLLRHDVWIFAWVPGLSGWGLALLFLGLMGLAFWRLRSARVRESASAA